MSAEVPAVRAVSMSVARIPCCRSPPYRLQRVGWVQTDTAEGLYITGGCLALACMVSHSQSVLGPAQVIIFYDNAVATACYHFSMLAKFFSDH